MIDISNLENRADEELEVWRDRLWNAFVLAGGRDIETANALDALDWELEKRGLAYECEDCSINGSGCREHGAASRIARENILANPQRVIEMFAAQDAIARMSDPAEYRRVFESTERHPCPVPGCRLSAEEHHRIAFGVLAELRGLRKRVAEK